jgi:hypothetical protein
MITRHATVFFGAVFFVIKEILPRGTFSSCNTKIYTPTAVLSIRGTSFEVAVENKNGTTDVRVINGTVQVGNILKNQSILTSAGYSTRVAMNTEPVSPYVLLDKDIDALKTWVPKEIVDAEMKFQASKKNGIESAGVESGSEETNSATCLIVQPDKKSAGSADSSKAKRIPDIIVLPFENKAFYEGKWNISTGFSSYIAKAIATGKPALAVFTVKTAVPDPVIFGELNKAGYVLTGQVRTFDIVQRASISVDAAEYREYCIANVGINVELIDIKKRTVIFSRELSGEATGDNKPENNQKEIEKYAFDMKSGKFSQTILGKAVESTVKQAAEELSRYLP